MPLFKLNSFRKSKSEKAKMDALKNSSPDYQEYLKMVQEYQKKMAQANANLDKFVSITENKAEEIRRSM